MNLLKNITDSPSVLKEMIPYRENRVISKALSKSEHCQMMLMSVSLGEEVTSEQYPGDIFYYVIDGIMPLHKEGQSYQLHEGQCMAIEAGLPHAIGGAGAFKLLQITITN